MAESLESPKSEAKKTVKVKKAKKAESKKSPKAAKASKLSSAAKPAKTVNRAMGEGTPTDRRMKLVKALRSAGATKATAAKSMEYLATKTGFTRFDVYGLLRGTSGKADSNPRCLVATGHASIVSIEGQGLSAYLTAKGLKKDPE